MTNRRAIRTL